MTLEIYKFKHAMIISLNKKLNNNIWHSGQKKNKQEQHQNNNM